MYIRRRKHEPASVPISLPNLQLGLRARALVYKLKTITTMGDGFNLGGPDRIRTGDLLRDREA
jgi:hypothetical protein